MGNPRIKQRMDYEDMHSMQPTYSQYKLAKIEWTLYKMHTLCYFRYF